MKCYFCQTERPTNVADSHRLTQLIECPECARQPHMNSATTIYVDGALGGAYMYFTWREKKMRVCIFPQSRKVEIGPFFDAGTVTKTVSFNYNDSININPTNVIDKIRMYSLFS